jgi:hypothetical protein
MPRSTLLSNDTPRFAPLDSSGAENTVTGVYTDAPSTLAPHPPVPPAVDSHHRDHAPLWRLAGIESCRAATLDLVSLMLDTGHWVSDGVEAPGEPAERRLEASFPGLQDKLLMLDDSPQQLVTHRLSPRRWAFAWRTGPRSGILALVRFRDGKPEPSESETLLVRVVCEAWFSASLSASAAQAGQLDDGGWTGVDRRSSQPQSKGFWLRAGLFAGSALLALWMATGGVDLMATESQQHRLTSERLAALGDKTLATKVGQVLAGGDYGEVQETLSTFSALGYFTGALVLNPRGQVVAIAGAVGDQRIGVARASNTLVGGHVVPLGQDGQNWGQLVLADAGATAGQNRPGTSSSVLRAVAAIVALMASIGLVLQLRPVWPLRATQRRR